MVRLEPMHTEHHPQPFDQPERMYHDSHEAVHWTAGAAVGSMMGGALTWVDPLASIVWAAAMMVGAVAVAWRHRRLIGR